MTNTERILTAYSILADFFLMSHHWDCVPEALEGQRLRERYDRGCEIFHEVWDILHRETLDDCTHADTLVWARSRMRDQNDRQAIIVNDDHLSSALLEQRDHALMDVLDEVGTRFAQLRLHLKTGEQS